ncbi:helix-turn-helix domain-containing protein [Streptomyces sp. NPDC058086]|uniref:helix-turn-helix domain-containing protein n=1 Tax=Streptomyces sp. NPDC058086 TaxID=3346334 RepID=UPI0036E62607
MFEGVLRSEDLPVADRFEWWCGLISRSLLPSVVTSDHADDFRASIKRLEVGDSRASVVSYSPMRVRRTPALVRRSDPQLYHLALPTRGKRGVSQCGRDALFEEGSLLLYDSSHPYDSQCFAEQGEAGAIIVDVPRAALPLPGAKVDRLLVTPLPGNIGVGGLLSQFLIGLTGEPAAYHPQDAVRLGTVMTDLVTVFLAHHLDAADAVPPDSRQQALMVSIHSFIERNLGDPQLSPGVVAAAHHISVRYLHRLFQQQGTTVGGWIRHRRLERCRRDLAEPALSLRPIHAVGARWGFRHAADFSRAFRAAYGMPPGEYRHRAYGRDGGV